MTIPGPPRSAPGPLDWLVHVVGLVVVALVIGWLALHDGHTLDIMLSAAIGFGAGVAFDRWILRPAVDLSNALRRT